METDTPVRSSETERLLPDELVELQEEQIRFDDDDRTPARPQSSSYSLKLGSTRSVKVIYAEDEEKEAFLVLEKRKCLCMCCMV